MWHMYAKYANLCEKSWNADRSLPILKAHHHVCLDVEFKADCRIWIDFLTHEDLAKIVCHPMIDFNMKDSCVILPFYTDASTGMELGFGCVFGKNWTYGRWESQFIEVCKPSIEFLELYALCVGILTWEERLKNCRIMIYCDNKAVVGMVNKLASSCKKCMTLLRILTLNGLIYNRRVSVLYVKLADKILADALSHLNLKCFRQFGPDMNEK